MSTVAFRLADLIPPVAEAFLKDQITIGHALLIAKLPASQQQEAFSAAFRGLWTSEGNSQVLIPVRELAAWIESNILLQLASAPFDKQDETLVPEAGSCANCPKRTGFNKLLFPDVRKDSCTSPDCFRAKIDASVKKTLETKPQLIQISAAWNSREGAPLGRNQYVELEIKKPKPNGASTKLPANQKPCDKMAEAIVMDGGKRGQVVKVCADPACRIHHPNTPSPQQVERERAEERKRIEKEKLAITTRHRVLATILQRVSAPLKKADLLAVAHYLIGHLSYSQVPALAKRHKVEAKKDSASAQELLAKQVGTYDEAELCKLLLEISLLDSAYQRSTASRDDVLMDAAKRYRVDAEKLQKAVAQELAAKRDKKTSQESRRAARRQHELDPSLISGGVLVCTPPFLLDRVPRTEKKPPKRIKTPYHGALRGKAVNITVIRNAIGTLEQLLSKASDALSQIEREVFNLYAFGRAKGGYEYPREAMEGYLQEIHDLLLVVLEAGEMPGARASLVKAWAGFTSSRNNLRKTDDNGEFANSSSPALTFLERLIKGLRATVSEEISSEEAWTLGRLEEILEDTAALVRRRGDSPSKESDVQKVMHDYLRAFFPGFVLNPSIGGALKNFKPDCGIANVTAAIEFKFVETEEDVATAFSGIAEDTAGYKGSKDWTRFYAVLYQSKPFALRSQFKSDMKRIGATTWKTILVNGPTRKKSLKKRMKKKNTRKKKAG